MKCHADTQMDMVLVFRQNSRGGFNQALLISHRQVFLLGRYVTSPQKPESSKRRV